MNERTLGSEIAVLPVNNDWTPSFPGDDGIRYLGAQSVPPVTAQAPVAAPNGPGGVLGSLARSITNPLAQVLQSIGVKDKTTAQYMAGAIVLFAPFGLLIWFLFFRRKGK